MTVRVIVSTVVIELVPTTMLVSLIAKFAACEPLSVSAPDQFEGLTAQLATWVPAATGTVNGPPAVQLIPVEAGLLKTLETVVLAAKADTGARNSTTVARKFFHRKRLRQGSEITVDLQHFGVVFMSWCPGFADRPSPCKQRCRGARSGATSNLVRQ
jgi:hypothetical protein